MGIQCVQKPPEMGTAVKSAFQVRPGYFDTIRHSVLLDKIAKRVQDPRVMHLVKQMIKVDGHVGVAQGGPFSPLAAVE